MLHNAAQRCARTAAGGPAVRRQETAATPTVARRQMQQQQRAAGPRAPAACGRQQQRRQGRGLLTTTRAVSNGRAVGPLLGGDVGVVIVDHGSRKAESNDMLHEFAELYRRVSGRPLVEVAHMELAEPTIEQAVGRCAAAGARRIIVAPYFLSRGRHVQQDIPALVEAAAAAHPGVECVVADPIGIDTLMAQIIESRVAAAEAGAAAAAAAAPAAGTSAAPSASAAGMAAFAAAAAAVAAVAAVAVGGQG